MEEEELRGVERADPQDVRRVREAAGRAQVEGVQARQEEVEGQAGGELGCEVEGDC